MTDAPASAPPPDHGARAAAEHGVARSPHWPHVRAEQLRREPLCQATGLTAAGAELEAHHIYPFHCCVLAGRADLELDLRNLITLARHPIDVHLLLGHLDDFRSSNLDVAADAAEWSARWQAAPAASDEAAEAAIKADPVWRGRHAARMRPWAEWTAAERADFRAHLDQLFPPAVVILPHPAAA
jgi:hypothetical protein